MYFKMIQTNETRQNCKKLYLGTIQNLTKNIEILFFEVRQYSFEFHRKISMKISF